MADYKIVDTQQLETDLTAVADAIRAQSGETEALAFPEGYVSGVEAAGDKRFSDGEQSMYDAFWDAHQQNGARTDYRFAFAGNGWSQIVKNGLFKPKYPIKPKNLYKHNNPAYSMFAYFNNAAKDFVDFSGIDIDFSGCTEASEVFQNCRIKNLTCDFGNCWLMNRTFNAPDSDRGGVHRRVRE